MWEKIKTKTKQLKDTLVQGLISVYKTVTDLSLYLDGSLYILMLVTLLSTSVLIGYGSYILIIDTHLFNLIFFGGAVISMIIHGMAKYLMNTNQKPRP